MVNREIVSEALGYLKGTMLEDYANNIKVFNTESRVNDIKRKIEYTNDCLKFISGFETLKFSMFIRACYSEVIDIQFAFVFKVNGRKTQKCNLSIPRDTFNSLTDWFVERVEDFLYAENIIESINIGVDDYVREHGCSCDVDYVCDYTRKTENSVVKWSYNKICFAIGFDFIVKMREHSDYLRYDFSTADYYNGNIKDLLEQFNTFDLHRMIGISLQGTVKDILCKTQLSMNEAIRKIMKDRLKSCVQDIVTCTYINELGEYIVLCNWHVDYKNRKIDISVLDRKIMDLQTGRFYYSGEIYNKIERRVQLPEQRSPIIFGDITVEEFLNQ